MSCRALAFVEKDIDWQIWIEDGPQLIPCKLVITYKTRPVAAAIHRGIQRLGLRAAHRSIRIHAGAAAGNVEDPVRDGRCHQVADGRASMIIRFTTGSERPSGSGWRAVGASRDRGRARRGIPRRVRWLPRRRVRRLPWRGVRWFHGGGPALATEASPTAAAMPVLAGVDLAASTTPAVFRPRRHLPPEPSRIPARRAPSSSRPTRGAQSASQLQQNRTNEANNLQSNRINEANNLQNNRENTFNNYNNRWGGYYSGAGFGAGLAIGATLAVLPAAVAAISVAGNPYYYANGVYYAPQGGQYAVVPPPQGAVVTTPPPSCSTVYVGTTPNLDCGGAFYATVPAAIR